MMARMLVVAWLGVLALIGPRSVSAAGSHLQSHWPQGVHHLEDVLAFHETASSSRPEAQEKFIQLRQHRQAVRNRKAGGEDASQRQVHLSQFYLNLLEKAEKATGGSSSREKLKTRAEKLIRSKQDPICAAYGVSVTAEEMVAKADENRLDTQIDSKEKEEKSRAEQEEERLQKLLNKEIKERKYNGAGLSFSHKAQATSIQERIARVSKYVTKTHSKMVEFQMKTAHLQAGLQKFLWYMGANRHAVDPLNEGNAT